jgi:hypothetical protein
MGGAQNGGRGAATSRSFSGDPRPLLYLGADLLEASPGFRSDERPSRRLRRQQLGRALGSGLTGQRASRLASFDDGGGTQALRRRLS